MTFLEGLLLVLCLFGWMCALGFWLDVCTARKLVDAWKQAANDAFTIAERATSAAEKMRKP